MAGALMKTTAMAMAMAVAMAMVMVIASVGLIVRGGDLVNNYFFV